MCGVVALLSNEPVNQRLYDALLLLQHRGQDAAGIATLDGLQFHMHKAMGLVRDIFRTRNMRDLTGNVGVGHVRYPTQGCASSNQESQPFYVNAPFGIMFAHNGNLTNAEELKQELYETDRRHINTTSDSEVLLNVLANEISRVTADRKLDADGIFEAVSAVHRRVRGSYAVVALIAGKGLLAFRDPHGIRPLCFGSNVTATGEKEWMVSSESVTMVGLGFKLERDVAPGEAIWFDFKGNVETRQCAEHAVANPCAFEYVYFARPDSVIDGISVYGARLNLGVYLAKTVAEELNLMDVDVVMPIPDSSRPCAQELAKQLRLPYREGFIKNRYVGRTFIMPGQAVRKKSVRQKLNAMPVEFEGKNLLLVDDSIVRGTTMKEIVRMARESGAKKVFVASSAPRVMFPNVYGIDMPTKSELICGDGKDADAVAKELGADKVIFQSIDGLKNALHDLNPNIPAFDCSCFDGVYVTGDVTEAYLEKLGKAGKAAAKENDEDDAQAGNVE
ncbi:amidophosphoribosyltransferase [Sutterella faecalis]|uniref:Amidophosphoribosyltransferase n=2 Tax=Sutterella TaxID=40544 RepID=A0AAI9SBR8_9BURK|nr:MULTISPECIES: amidophosphoribosyltransferase [Sutterella]KAB7651313.1 amidophosphoribosyltransferase [Sutterella seckii]QDA55365.1 amidophosphoribosyltransferase [Sutterella faecalis]